MKTAGIIALLVTSATAFTATNRPFGRPQVALQEKINTKIELESAKVVNTDALEAGEKKVYCRCWKSGTFPLCDAAHVEHNKENGKTRLLFILAASRWRIPRRLYCCLFTYLMFSFPYCN